jgi:AraC-like DNA-binding protein
MATTDMKLLDIAAESGFNSAARFYPSFKRLVGQSPARYRRSVQASARAAAWDATKQVDKV